MVGDGESLLRILELLFVTSATPMLIYLIRINFRADKFSRGLIFSHRANLCFARTYFRAFAPKTGKIFKFDADFAKKYAKLNLAWTYFRAKGSVRENKYARKLIRAKIYPRENLYE